MRKPDPFAGLPIRETRVNLAALGVKETEADFQLRVMALARQCGWHVVHIRKVRVQRANGSVYYATPYSGDGEGFFDLHLYRDRHIVAELKTDTGRLSLEQKLWQQWYQKAGVVAVVWRPRDWVEIVQTLA